MPTICLADSKELTTYKFNTYLGFSEAGTRQPSNGAQLIAASTDTLFAVV
ncbi:MAG: hypothetical protein QOI13_3514, partial [Paraburkholderia sp.]|nr:hypothetical protein [Paraburkholderia sp.]